MSIKEQYLIFDRGGSAYVLELGHELYLPVYIHITIWCVMDFPVQWDIEVEILGVLFVLMHNDGWNEALPIRLVKDK